MREFVDTYVNSHWILINLGVEQISLWHTDAHTHTHTYTHTHAHAHAHAHAHTRKVIECVAVLQCAAVCCSV